jgi:uncharacterized protein YabE (DUF348 family)
VTYSYEQVNGKETKKQVAEEKLWQPSVTEVVAQGPVPEIIKVASRGFGR